MLNAVEQTALNSFRAGEHSAAFTTVLRGHDDWLRFGIQLLLETGRRVRAMRFAPLANTVVFKEDGSPSVSEETAIEQHLRDQLQRVAPQAGVMGEESGGELSKNGISVAIDPVDGTWALVNRSATHAISLAFFEHGQVFLGMVANASNGEIAYALAGQRSRLLQLSCFGEPDLAFDLPLDRSPGEPTLVNLHPARGGVDFSICLQEAWNQSKIGKLKGIGGSPSWSLLEAAKGSYIYVNRWSGKAAEPYDLAGSVFLLRQAGGETVGLDGQPIDAFRHQGPFIAGINGPAVSEIATLCRDYAGL
jgi:histidinol-phosphatase